MSDKDYAESKLWACPVCGEVTGSAPCACEREEVEKND